MEGYEHYSLSYRAAETRRVMDWIKAGQCGAIIGLPGTGKSTFLHFLFREDVRQQYLGEENHRFIFIFVDLLSLIENPDWAIYELILSRLARQLRASIIEQKIVEQVTLLHQEIMNNRDVLSAHRTLEKSIDIICEQSKWQVILFFDEFDTVFKTFSPTLFRYLRGLRNTHNGQLSYIVSVTTELTALRNDLAEIDHFYRLVNRNSCRIGPVCEADAREMIKFVLSQRSIELRETDILSLMELTGRYGGLIQAILGLIGNNKFEKNLIKFELAIQSDEVQRQCRKIWELLSWNEQLLLYSLVNREKINLQGADHLLQRGLLQKVNPPIIFSPLFSAFVRKQTPSLAESTYVGRSPQVVQLEGHRIDNLTELEFELLCYLYEQRGHTCTRDDLVENVYRQRYEDNMGGITQNAIHALISRLRKKIKTYHLASDYVVTVRGGGYRFIQPQDV